MKRVLVLLSLLLASWSLPAQQLFVEFSGTVTAVNGVRDGALAGVQAGDAVSGIVVYDPSTFPAGSGDGSTWQYVRAPWTDGLDLMRTSITIGGQRFDTEEYAWRLGTSGLDNAHFTASQQDRFFVVDWSSPYDLSNPNVSTAPLRTATVNVVAPGSSDFVTAPLADLHQPLDFSKATGLDGMLVDGTGVRFGANVWGFDFNVPPANPDRHAMQVLFRIDSITKVTCMNRVVWVDFGWLWPSHPLTCAESQRGQ